MAAKPVNEPAGPLERPTTPSMFALLGVASNWASKAPVCEGMRLSCQAPALLRQLGAVTLIVAVPFLPSLVAMIVAVPAATPATRPLPLTVATAALLNVHVTLRPVSVFPAESVVTGVSCTVAPPGTLAVAGPTVTDATGSAGRAGSRIATSAMLFQAPVLLPWPTMRTSRPEAVGKA